jgi:hypothetical protein
MDKEYGHGAAWSCSIEIWTMDMQHGLAAKECIYKQHEHSAWIQGFPFFVKKLFTCNIVTDVTDGYYVRITVVTT